MVLDLCAPGYTQPAPRVVKGDPVRCFVHETNNGLSNEVVDCGAYNAVNVEVFVTGSSPSATLTVEGGPERGANTLLLDDPNATQTITAAYSFDVIVGPVWARVRLADISGVFGRSQGFTVTVTPYVAPALARPAITFGA